MALFQAPAEEIRRQTQLVLFEVIFDEVAQGQRRGAGILPAVIHQKAAEVAQRHEYRQQRFARPGQPLSRLPRGKRVGQMAQQRSFARSGLAAQQEDGMAG